MLVGMRRHTRRASSLTSALVNYARSSHMTCGNSMLISFANSTK